LDSAPEKTRDATHCKNRKPWYSVPLIYSPEAIIPYMSGEWPLITINQSKATCTNNIHRLSWREDVRTKKNWNAVALGSHTTLCNLSAEIYGRNYGRGVLKLEIREAGRLVFPFCDDVNSRTIGHVDTLIRKRGTESVNMIADEILLKNFLGLTTKEIVQLRQLRDEVLSRRKMIGGNSERKKRIGAT
jgi:adenine-specific DNA-methyltransferase